MVNTLLNRAQQIPSTNAERSRERKHMIKALKDNNYPLHFIQSCKSYRDTANHEPYNSDTFTTNTTPTSNTFVVLPYVRGVSENLSRVLRNNGLKVGYKPLNVLCACFPRPKDKPSAAQTRGAVYKIVCSDCDFVYCGQRTGPCKLG